MNNPRASTSDSPQREIKRVNINNSLSTISPAHYEVMSTATNPAQPGTQGGRPLTKHDIFQWHLEQAQQLGEVGFTTNFPDPSDIFQPFTIHSSSEDELVAESRDALSATLLETHKANVQLHQRKIIMDGAGPLLAKTEIDVNQKLLAAGVPEQDLAFKTLRQKIVQLVELQKPPPKENFAAVLVEVGSTSNGRSHMLEINLPLKASVAVIYALLDEVVKALLSEKALLYEGGGTWKYQLIDQSRSHLLLDKSSQLETDLDYRMMLQQMSRVGDGEAPVAVLTQGGLARPIDISEVNAKAETLDKDDDGLEILDEDGKPFFEPLDMDRMAEKYANIGMDLTENGIHGFWR